MVRLVQAELLRHAIEAARQPLAQRLGTFPARRGDVRPLAAVGPRVRQLALLGAQTLAELGQELAAGHLVARARLAVGDLFARGAALLDPAHVTRARTLPPRLVD